VWQLTVRNIPSVDFQPYKALYAGDKKEAIFPHPQKNILSFLRCRHSFPLLFAFERNIKGQKKRLAMVAALLERRKFLILDEWAADQDPEFRRHFYVEFLPELKAQGYTIFAISHDDAYFDAADRIYEIRNGQISKIK